jgi:hypothetical protein
VALTAKFRKNNLNSPNTYKAMARTPSFNTTAFYFILVKFRQLATEINPVRPLGRNFKKELPEHSPYFLEKKKKKNGRICQI